jgi:hypothetical protein
VAVSSYAVSISSREWTYLRNADFLPPALAKQIQGAEEIANGRYVVRVSAQSAEELRSAFTERLAKVGFDMNYIPTAEGRMLEELLDLFYKDLSSDPKQRS